MNRHIVQTPSFARALKARLKSHPQQAGAIADALQQLAADAFHPSLRPHKLKGQLAGCWSCSAGYDLRILFTIQATTGGESIELLTLGTHDQVY